MKKFYLLPFFIFCLGIFVSSSSIVNAWTFDDIYDLANNVDVTLLTTDQATTRDRILNHFNEYVQAFEDSGRSFDNYHSFIVWYRNYDGINFQCFSSNSSNWSVNSNGYITNGQTIGTNYPDNSFGIYYSSGQWNVSTSTNSSQNKSKAICLLAGAGTQVLNTSGLIAQNVYNSIVTTNVNVPSNASVPYLFTQGVVGLHYDITNVYYKLVLKGASGTQDTFNQDLGAVFSETGNGHSVNLQLTTLNTIHGSNNYYIDMYYSGDIIYTSDTFQISYSGGGSSGGSTSGDSPGGSSIDLTETNNKIDNVASKIDTTNALLISGDKKATERDNFWRDTYNNLFTLNSGDVADIYNDIAGALSSGDSLIVAYQPIQDLLEAEPSDFVIRWGNIPILLTINNGVALTSGDLITSGEINFSQMARDNSTLGTIKFWVNTIISFSLFYLCLFEIYKIILYILGQTPSLVEAVTSDEESTTETIIDTDYYNHSDSVSKVVSGVRQTDSTGHNTTKTTTRRRKL